MRYNTTLGFSLCRACIKRVWEGRKVIGILIDIFWMFLEGGGRVISIPPN